MRQTTAADLYAVLGVARDAPAREIRRAYRRLARQHHPDLSRHPDGAERFTHIAHAYEVLHDPTRRARYDRAVGKPPTSVARGGDTSEPPASAQSVVRRGVLELSAAEARHLAHQPLTLRDALGRTIVLPAGTTDGAQITVTGDAFTAVLKIRTPTRT